MRVPSTLTLRLLAFNLLLVFLPVAAFLYLDIYERQLLETQERSMVQQGRLLSAALAERGVLTLEVAEPILTNLQQRTEARIRVVNHTGRLLADSSRLGPQRQPQPAEVPPQPELRDKMLYRLGALLARVVPGAFARPRPASPGTDIYAGQGFLRGNEVRSALAGRYGATTRLTAGSQRSVTLYSAIPVRSGDDVVGAVLVSQSTYRILAAVYEVRLGIFRIFLLSVGVAVLLSLFVAGTISRPIQKIAARAREIVDRRGRLRGHFRGTDKRDEIGELARALEDLTRRLERHVHSVEAFAADVSHELKNPLTSIRSATELLAEVESAEDRQKFLEIVQQEIVRMEELLGGVREMGRIDAQLEDEERQRVDLDEVLQRVVEGFRLGRLPDGVGISYEPPGVPVPVAASDERLVQIVENLLDNAAGFAPAARASRLP